MKAIEFVKGEIEESAFGYHERYRTEQDVVVGVNRYVEDDAEVEETLRVDPATERAQVERLAAYKAARDGDEVSARLAAVRETAGGTGNLLPPIREALRARCTVGEVCGALREVFGEYQPES